MKQHFALGLITAASLALVGCGASAEPATSAPAGDNRPTATETSSSPTPTVAPDPGYQAFGTTYTYTDGLSVTVSAPQPYQPSPYAAGVDGFSQFVVFDITVVNQTGTNWDPVLFGASVQSGNQEASQVFDSGNLPANPSTVVLSGREAVFKMAFGVMDPNDLVMEVRPDFTHDDAIYVLGA